LNSLTLQKNFKHVFNVPEIWGLLFLKWLYTFFPPPHTHRILRWRIKQGCILNSIRY